MQKKCKLLFRSLPFTRQYYTTYNTNTLTRYPKLGSCSKDLHTFSHLTRNYQVHFGECSESENSITMVLQSYYCCCFPSKTSIQKLQNCSCS